MSKAPARGSRFTFIAKLAACVPLIAITDYLLIQNEGWHGTAFGWIALAWLIITICVSPAARKDARARGLFTAAGLLTMTLFWDPNLLGWSLYWCALIMAVLIPRTTKFDDAIAWTQRIIFASATGLFGPIVDTVRVLKLPSSRSFARAQRVIPVLIVPVIGGAIFVWLFASANPLIETFFDAWSLPDVDTFRVLPWVIFFFVFWSVFRPRHIRDRFIQRVGDVALLQRIPALSILMSLILFNAIFAVQNTLDIAFVWSGITLPAGMSYAEYVHRGVYPLIGTALLAGVFVVALLKPGSETAERPLIRRLVMMWVAQNVLLLAFAAYRLVQYVEVYQLTVARIAVFVLLFLITLGLVTICWRVLAGKSARWLVNVNAAAAVLVLSISSAADFEAMTAWYNVEHNREVRGEGQRLDLCHLEWMGSSAALPLIALEARHDIAPFFRDRVSNARRTVMRGLRRSVGENGRTWQDARRLAEAETQLAALQNPGRSLPWLDCLGNDRRQYGSEPVQIPDLVLPAPQAQSDPDQTEAEGETGVAND